MMILPAIDIKDAKCVRLLKGDFDTVEQVAENPLDTAASFEAAGAEWIHMVDLDGALARKPVNACIFTAVASATSLKVELGGGIRTMEDIGFYLNLGIERVILGSVAVKNPALVREAVKEFGPAIAVGIDAKNGYVASEGWLEKSNLHFIELAKQMEQAGVTNLIYTDISRDGTLSGPNLPQLRQLNEAVSCDVTASGGVTTLHDIKALRDSGLYGAICGKSIYKGTLSLEEAVTVCK